MLAANLFSSYMLLPFKCPAFNPLGEKKLFTLMLTLSLFYTSIHKRRLRLTSNHLKLLDFKCTNVDGFTIALPCSHWCPLYPAMHWQLKEPHSPWQRPLVPHEGRPMFTQLLSVIEQPGELAEESAGEPRSYTCEKETYITVGVCVCV